GNGGDPAAPRQPDAAADDRAGEGAMGELLITVRETVDEWLRIRWSDLQFGELRTAILVCVVLLAIALLGLLAQLVRSRRPGRAQIVMPAIVPAMRRSPWSAVRHAPLLLFLVGVPLFAIALADPHTGFSQEDVSYPGRRIALLVDASTSMIMEFQS